MVQKGPEFKLGGVQLSIATNIMEKKMLRKIFEDIVAGVRMCPEFVGRDKAMENINAGASPFAPEK